MEGPTQGLNCDFFYQWFLIIPSCQIHSNFEVRKEMTLTFDNKISYFRNVKFLIKPLFVPTVMRFETKCQEGWFKSVIFTKKENLFEAAVKRSL